MIVESVEVIVCSWLDDVALLTKTSTNVVVNICKPLSKLLIIVSITINLVKSIEEILGAGSISKSLEDCLKVGQRGSGSLVEV
jgi:hypothetical protein